MGESHIANNNSFLEGIEERVENNIEYLRCMRIGRKIQSRIETQFIDPPIIVGGCGRSGTTLLLSILSAHPKIYAIPEESGIFCLREKRFLYLNWRYNLTYLFGKYFQQVPEGATAWCEKTPANIRFYESINAKFNGRMKFIHIIRDGRDVVLSRHPLDQSTYWVDPERWVENVRLGLKYRDEPNVFTLKYEDLVVDYERIVGSLCEFMGLGGLEAMLDWHRNSTVKENRAWSGEVQPLFSDSVAKWKQPKYQERVAQFMANKEAVALLRELGYED